jgi:SHAQKYF class myb-like DNA-binding protein
MTKQRELWTEDEHRRFQEAVQLYGRAWRRIEGIARSMNTHRTYSKDLYHVMRYWTQYKQQQNSQ